MNKKLKDLVKRRNVSELESYFAALPAEKPLDFPEEKMLLASKDYNEVVVRSYFKFFPFSERAVILFLAVATPSARRSYMNRYGLPKGAQKYVIDHNLTDVASEFTSMHFFDDVDYMLAHATPDIIRMHTARTRLAKDAQVLKVLHNPNSSLFSGYVAKGYFISDKVIKTIIEERRTSAFRAVITRLYRQFKKLSEKLSIEEIRLKHSEVILSEELQIAVLEEFEPLMTELLLKYMPLWPGAQKFVITHNFDANKLKLHASHLYGIAGYRFEPIWEPELFKALSLKGMDDCLTQFQLQDDKVFLRYASPEAAIKYINNKDFWPSDDGQVGVILRGNVEIINALIGRFTPEHGMCWQAELEMVKMCSPDTIKKYASFHTMCREALDLLQKKCLEVYNYYFSIHPY